MLTWLSKTQKEQLRTLPQIEETLRHTVARVDIFTEAVNKMILETTALSKRVDLQNAALAGFRDWTSDLAEKVETNTNELIHLREKIAGFEKYENAQTAVITKLNYALESLNLLKADKPAQKTPPTTPQKAPRKKS